MQNLTFHTIQHGSEEYQQMLALRLTVLLRAVGLDASYIDIESEKKDWLLGAFSEEILVACCVLSPRQPQTMQLRQMAVAAAFQGKGVGAALLSFAENTALKMNVSRLYLHARAPVVLFYQKCGYEAVGTPFMEVGMEHVQMEKRIE